MKSAPIQLISLFFTDIRISALPKHNAADFNRYDLDVKTEVLAMSPDKPKARSVLLSIKIKPDDGAALAYIGEISLFGSFAVAETWDENRIEQLVYVNGSGMLYAAAREMICAITARGPWPMLTIPSWSFGQMFKELEEAKKKEAESAKQAPLGLTSSTLV
jgi:preprotein translocase subunit SecB